MLNRVKCGTVILSVFTLVVLLTGSSFAYQVIWNDGANEHIVFADSMEEEVGAILGTSMTVGAWGHVDGSLPIAIDDGFPGAATGVTYFKRERGGTHQLEALLDLNPNGGNAFTTGTLRVEFAYFLENDGPGGTHEWNSLAILDDRRGQSEVVTHAAAYILDKSACCDMSTDWWNDVADAPTGVGLNLGQWNLFSLFLDLDNDVSQLSINGVPGEQQYANDVSVSRVYGRAEDGGKYYFFDGTGTIATPPPPTQFTWNGATPGDWNSNSNWSATGVGQPDFQDHEAVFATLGSQGTVMTDQTVVVNKLRFENASSYIIAGMGQVTLAANSVAVDPAISVDSGSHQLQVNVQLDNDTTVNVATGAGLDFNNQLNFNGNTLIKQGGGTLSLNNAVVGIGAVDCQDGVCNGAGTVSGLINSGAVVAPGNSPGILSVDGNYTQSAGGTLEIELASNGGVAGTGHDRLAVTLAASLDGTLDLQLDGGYTPTIGDSFAGIVTAGALSGQFATTSNVVIDGRRGVAVTYTGTAVDAQIGLRGNTDIASGDIDVDTSDLTTSIINFTSAGGTGKTWADGDMDGDGDVDTSDLTTSIINFTSALGAAQSVPEPSSLMLLFGAVVTMLSCRRGR